MSQVNLQHWNAFLANQTGVHLLQCGEWGELKAAYGWRPVRIVQGTRGVQILFKSILPGSRFGYIPKGPVGNWTKELWAEVDQTVQANGAFLLRLENQGWMDDPVSDVDETVTGPGLIENTHPVQPRSTIIIDLRKTEEELLAAMKQKTRYNIRLAQKRGVEVRASQNIELFSRLMLETGRRDAFSVHRQSYYQKAYDLFAPLGACRLFVAYYEEEPLGAIMVFGYSNYAYYLYGASGDDNRNLMPNYLLQWEAMRWAKAQGKDYYDMWGIPDETEDRLEAEFLQRQDGLWKVYRFKRGFGGMVKRGLPAMDRVYNPWLYRLFLYFTNR